MAGDHVASPKDSLELCRTVCAVALSGFTILILEGSPSRYRSPRVPSNHPVGLLHPVHNNFAGSPRLASRIDEVSRLRTSKATAVPVSSMTGENFSSAETRKGLSVPD